MHYNGYIDYESMQICYYHLSYDSYDVLQILHQQLQQSIIGGTVYSTTQSTWTTYDYNCT
jgi:hypothetical protein